MPTFVVSSTPSVRYRGRDKNNDPVNIALCWTFVPTTLREYPDNRGAPGIKFMMLEGEEVMWVYPDEATRDADYERLLQLFGKRLGDANG